MKKENAKDILTSHLTANYQNIIEEIIPATNIQSSYYFRHKFKISTIKEDKDFWIFTLEHDYSLKEINELITPPPIWYVNKTTGHCIFNLYVDDKIIYNEWIQKYKIFESKRFYNELLKKDIQIKLNLEKAISLWHFSNLSDEYSFLSFLEMNKQLGNLNISKTESMKTYFLLKSNKELLNEELIERMLSEIPYPEYESDKSWNLIKKIISLPEKDKLELHKKTSMRIIENYW